MVLAQANTHTKTGVRTGVGTVLARGARVVQSAPEPLKPSAFGESITAFHEHVGILIPVAPTAAAAVATSTLAKAATTAAAAAASTFPKAALVAT
jgi:hypothetical protein